MKTNKTAIIICGIMTLISFAASIRIHGSWWQNICFAIFGSSLLAAIISFVNYRIMRVELIEEIVHDVYKIGNLCNSELYSLPNEIHPQNFHSVVGLALDLVNSAAMKIEHYGNGIFCFERIKKEKLVLARNILERHYKLPLSDIAFLLEVDIESAKLYTQEIYKKIDKMLDSLEVYELVVDIASTSGSSIHTTIGNLDLIKKNASARLIKELENAHMSQK